MCFTGNFALTMMLEPAMLAPVLSQPSLPLDDPAGLEIAPDELAAVRERLEREDLTVWPTASRATGSAGRERFAAYAEALGDRFVARVLPDSAANPDAAAVLRARRGEPAQRGDRAPDRRGRPADDRRARRDPGVLRRPARAGWMTVARS